MLLGDWVRESTTTISIGTYSLAGAVTGFRSFHNMFGTSAKVKYSVHNVISGNPAGSYEVGIGTYNWNSGSPTLTRDIVTISSSGVGQKMSWGAGTKYIDLIADSSDFNALNLSMFCDGANGIGD